MRGFSTPTEITKCIIREYILVITSHDHHLTMVDLHGVVGGIIFVLDNTSLVPLFIYLEMSYDSKVLVRVALT